MKLGVNTTGIDDVDDARTMVADVTGFVRPVGDGREIGLFYRHRKLDYMGEDSEQRV